MLFGFNVDKLLKPDRCGIVVLNGKQMAQFSAGPSFPSRYGGSNTDRNDQARNQVAQIIDEMGAASSKAQKLPQVITTMGRFTGTSQRLYLKVKGSTVEGLLKVGERTIFYRDYSGRCKELNPLCVLDFYVHESLQRQGIGLQLFHAMIDREGELPNRIAYDKPSSKLLGFLDKHYGLKSYIPQNNNFVIFDAYWNTSYRIPNKTLDKIYQDPEREEVARVDHEQNQKHIDVRMSGFPSEEGIGLEGKNYHPDQPMVVREEPEEQRYQSQVKPRAGQLEREESDMRELHRQNMQQGLSKMHAMKSGRGSPYWIDENEYQNDTRFDNKFNTYSGGKHYGFKGLNQHQQSKDKIKEPQGLTGVPHYGDRFRKPTKNEEEHTLPALGKPRPSNNLDYIPPMLADPSINTGPSRAVQKRATTFDRELTSLE